MGEFLHRGPTPDQRVQAKTAPKLTKQLSSHASIDNHVDPQKQNNKKKSVPSVSKDAGYRPSRAIAEFISRVLLIGVAGGATIAGYASVTEAMKRGVTIEDILSRIPNPAEFFHIGDQTNAAETAEAGIISPIFTPQVQHWAPQISEWAALFQLDPNLVATVMQIESCGAPTVVSGSGAQGLFQVMPFHFAPGEDMLDPATNAARGLAYLALGLERAGGNVGLALAGYNGGHSQIGKDISLWPQETQRYWYWGTGIYDDAVNGAQTSARLQEWLDAGGSSLCETASEQLSQPSNW